MKTRHSTQVLARTPVWILLLASLAVGRPLSAAGPGGSIVISEIMYHPFHAVATPEDTKQEWIELFNRGAETVNLAGWRFRDGVDFVFPDVALAAGQYLVVAADVSVFKARYPGVTNVVGGWIGWLNNSGEKLELVDAAGALVNAIRYADQGEWGTRVLGPVSNGQRGWEWSAASDGGKRSLELINASLPNEYGRNWEVSRVDGGTPGQANSVAAADIAPILLDACHGPIIPKSSDKVTVSVRVVDEQATGLTVTLRHRVDASTYGNANTYPTFNAAGYQGVPMLDDGAHGDGQANDGVFGGVIPAQANGRIVEFYVEARDAGGKTRTWPAPSLIDGVPQQVTNALYQVDNAFNPTWTPGSPPTYYIIMTEMERGRLAYIGNHSTVSGPNAQMNATFISVDGTGMQLRYNVGARNRGHGSRNGPPNNQHVAFAADKTWNGRSALSFNCRYPYIQIMGCAFFRMAGFAAPVTTPVQLRINGANLATAGYMYGFYTRLDVFNSDFAKQQFSQDPDGNLYSCFRDNGEAEFLYRGTNPNSYRPSYFKESNASQDDWSDLIHLMDVLNNAPEATYLQEVGKVLNVPEWLRYIALDSLLGNYETGLNMGIGDDYFLYRGVADPRFVLIPHDLDTILGQGSAPLNQSIFSIVRGVAGYNGVDGLKRFFAQPEIVAQYYQTMLDLIDGFYNSQTLDPLVDRTLGGLVPADRIAAIKQHVRSRTAAVLAMIPQELTVDRTGALANGYLRSINSFASLSGTAHAGKTRCVLVNGQSADWSALDATWSLASVRVNPGVNRVLIQALDATGREFDRCSVDVWCDSRAMITKAGGTLSADEVWAGDVASYYVTGNIIIPAGRTLTIEPGTTVFLDADCGFIVHGRLVAQGAEYQRIRFTRVPGAATQWAGFQIPDSREDNIIAYADLEFGGSRSEWITTGNSSSMAGPTARLTIEHVTFRGSDTQYFGISDPQIIIRDSVFADLSSRPMCVAQRMPAEGWFLVEGSLFGRTRGNTDVLQLHSVSVPGGPVARIVDNVFAGGSGSLVASYGTDAYLEGNLFLHANLGGTGRSSSSALAVGTGSLNASQLTVVRNIFCDNDYGIRCTAGASAMVYGNTFLRNGGAILLEETGAADSGPGRAAYVDSCIFWNNGPEADGTAGSNGTGAFVNRHNTQLVVSNCIVASAFASLGTGNIDADPIFVDAGRAADVDANLPCLSTGFPGLAAGGYLLQGRIPDLHLRPESAALTAGSNGAGMGATIPAGVSISGAPDSVTWRTGATLTVGGPDLRGYKYRVNNGPWSAEALRPDAGPSLTPQPLPPIVLTGLQNGQSYTVSVLGRNAAGLWPSENSAAQSRTWKIDTSWRRLVINEVLAANQSVLAHGGAFPDLVELYYDGPTALDLSGMSLSDDPQQPATFVFPVGVKMDPGTYLVLYGDSGADGSGLHLGFGLKDEGDGLYLYDQTGALVDAVEFGRQLPDLSLGRVGPAGQWRPTQPTFGQPNVAAVLGDSRMIRINEWLAGADVLFSSDFIELYNPHPSPVDVGGMILTDDPVARPPQDTIQGPSLIAGQGYGVFWGDDANEPGHTRFRLSVDGEMIGLFDAQGQEIDKLFYRPQTTDFSEGRQPDGAARFVVLPLPTPGLANPEPLTADTNTITLVDENAAKRVLVPTAAVDNAWRSDPAFDDAAWTSGSGGVGFERSTGYGALFQIDVNAQMYGKNTSCCIRIPFSVTADVLQGLSTLRLKVRYDDGFVAYLNGVEVQRALFTGAPAWNSAASASHPDTDAVNWQTFDLSNSIGALHAGTNLLAIQAMNESTTSSDFLMSAVLEAAVQAADASGLDNALKLLDGLRITELMYRSPKGGNYDYVELKNILNEPLDVTGVRFHKGIDFTFPALTLPPGEYVVVAANQSAFRALYGAAPQVAGQYEGNLSDTGEKIILLLPSPFEAAILRFDYSSAWYPLTDGGGQSLTVQDPTDPPALWNEPACWRAADPTPGKP